MDILTLLEVLGTVIFGGGLLEFFKWLSLRKTEKKSAELDNIAKVQELANQKNGTVDEWERLSAQHSSDMEYYRTCLSDKDARLDEKEEIIAELREKINNLTSENTALRLTRCEKLSCPDRIPPFGFTKIDIKAGVLSDED